MRVYDPDCPDIRSKLIIAQDTVLVERAFGNAEAKTAQNAPSRSSAHANAFFLPIDQSTKNHDGFHQH